ncbi:DUF502 domain-containing protein [Saccharospirillum mangrovi]|uniref:DUF502 domain-containing protein n=1 Tax=Saccharospirillum mangrovi TaxID=2161747 RepID=UPI000D3379A5|nr:DUF502 domain-containing protein [Saccharospirillum mangrovi]
MKRILLRGTLSMLPLVISIWLFWSIAVTLDNLGRTLLELVGLNLPWAGSGFVLIVAMILTVGMALSVRPFHWLFRQFERQLLRFPVLKTVYGAVKDVATLISQNDDEPGRRQTVLVRQGNGYTVGFVTSDRLPGPLANAMPASDDDPWVPVLIQISYQVAGLTVLARRSDLIEVDWSFDEALAFMVTAGINRSGTE